MKTLEIRENCRKLRGCTNIITHMSAANHSRFPKLVLNES